MYISIRIMNMKMTNYRFLKEKKNPFETLFTFTARTVAQESYDVQRVI